VAPEERGEQVMVNIQRSGEISDGLVRV